MLTENHEAQLMHLTRRILEAGRCGVSLPGTSEDAVERDDAFATAIYDAISDECHRKNLKEGMRHLSQRLQWMVAVLQYLERNLENEMERIQEFDANDVTDPGGGGLTSASKA